MKKVIAVLIVFASLFLCSCGFDTSIYDKAYNEGYEDGYEAGRCADREDADDESWDKMNTAAEWIGKAIAMMDDFDTGDFTVDDIYDALCKADNALKGSV